MADAACAAMDQHLLAGLQRRAVDQSFPGRDEDEGQGGCFPHAEIGRLQRQQVGVDSGEFGERSLHTADASRHAIDLVARLEPRDVTPGLFDHAGEIQPENRRQRMARMRRGAGVDLGVERIDPARADSHQHLARADLGRGDR